MHNSSDCPQHKYADSLKSVVVKAFKYGVRVDRRYIYIGQLNENEREHLYMCLCMCGTTVKQTIEARTL